MPAKKFSLPSTKVILLIFIIVAELLGIVWFLSRSKSSPSPTTPTQDETSQPTPKQTIAGFSLSPTSDNLQVGESQTLSINLSAPSQLINGADVIITFNPQLVDVLDADPSLEGTQIQPTNLFPLYPVNRVDPQQGRIYLSALVQAPPPEPLHQNPPGPTLAQFTFRTLAPGTAQFKFEFTPGSTSTSTIIQSSTSQNLLTQVSGATFTISPQ
jgi:hypothetical protein